MISSDEAKFILKTHCFAEQKKNIPLVNATGFVLASDLYAACDVPAFDNAAMDGYALKYSPGKINYTVSNIIAAGDYPESLSGTDDAVRIFTGAPIPDNADTVIQQELCTRAGNNITINSPDITPGSNVRKRGTQNHKGQLLLEKGTKINEPMIAYLASAGINHVKIYATPSVAIIVTGSEIVANSQSTGEHQIYDANGPALVASLNTLLVKNVKLFYVTDNKKALKKIVSEALSEFDILIFTGGVSAGDYDFVRPVLEKEGVIQLIYKIAQKPGKPFYAGMKEDKWVFGLPGNPAAALTCFTQYVKPVILMMSGHPGAFEDFIELPLLTPYEKKPGLTFYLKAKIEKNGVTILYGQDSFDLSAYARANAYAEMPQEKDKCMAGELVKVYRI